MDLSKRREKAERDLEAAALAIPAAVLDGDKAGLKGLRRKRDDASAELADVGAAIGLQRERDEDAAAETADARRAEAVREVHRIEAERAAAAEVVDLMVSELEGAVAKHRLLGLELKSKLYEAGATGVRINGVAPQQMRWAFWHAAPITAELMKVPFATGNRRQSLASQQARGVPTFGNGEDKS